MVSHSSSISSISNISNISNISKYVNKSKICGILFVIIIIYTIYMVYKYMPSSFRHAYDLNIENFDISASPTIPTPTIILGVNDDQPTYDNSDDNVTNLITSIGSQLANYQSNISNFNTSAQFNTFNPYSTIDNVFRSSTIDTTNANSIVNNYTTYDNTGNLTATISNLSDQVNDLQNMVASLGLINTGSLIEPNVIKSANNGLELSIGKVPGNNNNYQVFLNNGCLSVGANDYDVKNCRTDDMKQYFNINTVTSDIDYQKNITRPELFNISSNANIKYPFVMLQSENNKDCLTNFHNQISMQPCSSSVNQRWIQLQTENANYQR